MKQWCYRGKTPILCRPHRDTYNPQNFTQLGGHLGGQKQKTCKRNFIKIQLLQRVFAVKITSDVLPLLTESGIMIY